MTSSTRRPSRLLPAATFGVSSLVAAFALATSGAASDAPGRLALHLTVVAAPIATGLVALRSRRSERFGRLLIATGLIWSLTILAEAGGSVAYSTGRVAVWLIFPVLIYVMLAFPQGRLAGGPERLLFRAVLALVVSLYVGSALVVEDYPRYSPWASCDTDCPPNAFQVTAEEPAFVDAVLAPLRDVLAVLLLSAVTVTLARRTLSASRLRAVTVAPVLLVSIVALLLLTAFIVARRAGEGDTAEAIGLAWALTLPAISVAFTVGLLQRRLLIGNVLSGLSLALAASPSPREVAAALRSSLGGPAVDVLVRDPDAGVWRRGDGTPVEPAAHAGDRVVRGVSNHGGPVAALVLREEIESDDELIDAVVSLTESALREASLKAELEASLEELEDSRKRIATAADAERRRIERDLHDGAQQRLIALRMRLALAEDLLSDDPGAAPDALQGLGDAVDQTLDEIRALARGIYPPVLADRGLPDALRSAGARSPLPVTIEAAGVTRQAPDVESAVYFTCLEALQNAVKHAVGASGVRVVLHQNHILRFEVADDGAGFDTTDPGVGNGFQNMRDRVESLGGTITVASRPGLGTVVSGTLPLHSVDAGSRSAVAPAT